MSDFEKAERLQTGTETSEADKTAIQIVEFLKRAANDDEHGCRVDTIETLGTVDPNEKAEIEMTALELLYLRSFIGLYFPETIAEFELTDIYNISAVSSAFLKFENKLKEMGVKVAPIPD